jgi:hypothetical protein
MWALIHEYGQIARREPTTGTHRVDDREAATPGAASTAV